MRGSFEEDYLREIERLYTKIDDQHGAELSELVAKYNAASDEPLDQLEGGSAKEEYAVQLQEQAHSNKQVQQIVFRSYILAICMVLEELLRILCTEVQRACKEKFSLKDVQGNGIRSCINYLEIVSGKNIFTQNSDLSFLIDLRNLIVHTNGVASAEKEKDLLGRLNKTGLKLDFHDGNLFLKKEWLRSYLDVFVSTIASFRALDMK